MNPATTDNKWDNKWNQTADLTIPADKNCFNINAGEWDGANGTWSVYEPTEPITTQPITTQPIETGNTLYFAPSSNWKESDARFAMYMWGDGIEGTFTSMTKTVDGVYTAKLADGCTSVIFARMNPETTDNNWDNRWNQTADLTVPQYNNLFTLNAGEWDNANGTWSMYYEPTEPVTTEPVTTQPVTTEPVTTEPVTTEPVTTQPVTTEPVETTIPVTDPTPEFTYTVLEDGTAEITGYTGNDSTVVIPSTIDGYKVTSIGSYTISSYYNDDRTALVISEGIKTIKSTAFSNWYSLKEVQLPESLETIGTEAFYYCQNLETINFPDNLVSIGDGAFSYCSKIKEVSITGGKLTLVDDWAFNRCDSIESVTLNGNNAEIGSYAFNDCVNLTSLTLNGIKILGEQAFDCCNLENVVLPDGLERMDYSTFASNTNLKTVVVPQSVTYMQTSTFYDVADNFTMFGYTGSYAETFVKNNLMLGITFVALDNFEYEVLEDGTIKVTDYFGEGDTLVIPSRIDGYQVSIFDGSSFGQNKYDVKKLVLCDGIKKVERYACYHWSKLEEVYLAYSVEVIGDNAFYECENLTTINFPANLEFIGEFAFRFCTNLKIAEITGGKLTYIDYNALLIKLNLSGIKTIKDSAFVNMFITEVVLPEGLEAIKGYAFGNCNFLTKVVIPKSVTTIDYGAFNGKVVIYGYTGSEAEAYANKRGFTFIPLDGGADITGDIDLTLLKTDENIYSADIELKAGTYKFNVDNAGNVLGFKGTYTDTAVINYSGGFKAQSTLIATGGRYTFTFNTSTKKLTIKHKSFDDIVELVGGINAELVRPNKNTTVFTGTVKLTAGTYYFNVYEGGQIYGLNYLFEDVIYDHPFNWTTPTGFKATGGTYSVKYDTATNQLKILHTPAGLGDVTIFGDINIPLAEQGNSVYSAQTVLEAGSYDFRVDSFGTIFGNGSKFTDIVNVEFKNNWKSAATLNVTEKMKFTFIFDTKTNTVKVFNAPIDTTTVKVAFDDIDALELTSVDDVTYTGTVSLEAGDYTFRMDEFGVPMGSKYTFTDSASNILYNVGFVSATTMTATGGTYTFTFNTDTDTLSVTKA